jgi:hypothetical protein
MKPAPVTLPPHCAQRVGPDLAAQIVGVGETALLAEPLLGLIASRECPGHVLLETLDRVPEWVKAGRVIVSGFPLAAGTAGAALGASTQGARGQGAGAWHDRLPPAT